MGKTQSRGADRGGEASVNLEVVDGPQEGLRICEVIDSLTVGRGIENTIELFGDPIASNEHATFMWSREHGTWLVNDVGSKNGTWLDGRRIEGPSPIKVGAEVVIGQTVIAFRESAAVETFLPTEFQVDDEISRLQQVVDPRMARSLIAASALAVAEQRPSLSERHLILGVAMTNADLDIFAPEVGAVPRSFLADSLKGDDFWIGRKAWINQRISVAPPGDALFAEEVVFTPRVLRYLLEAEALVLGEGRELIHPLDVISVVFGDPTSRTREMFVRDGFDARDVVRRVARSVRDTPSMIPAGRTPAPAAATPSGGVIPRQASIVAPTIGAGVQDIGSEVSRVAALYRLSDPRERRSAIREVLAAEVAKVPVDRRVSLLEEVRHLFPVEQFAPPPADDSEVLRRQVAELKAKVASGAEAEAPRRGVPWARILSGQGRELAAEVEAEDAVGVAFVADILDFSVSIERFVVAMAHGMSQGSGSTARAQLPGFQISIGRAASQIASNKKLDREELDRYLGSLESWLVATVAGYHDGPESWFAAFWGKVSPTRIEAKVPKSFGSDGKCWGRYKELVRSITPDLVSDEIQVLVREKAEEQVKKLMSRRVRR